MRNRSLVVSSVVALCTLAASGSARAQDTMGAPPPDAKALVEAPKTTTAPPKLETPKSETSVTLSAGGLLSTGNSQLAAATANGKFEMRRGADGFGASLLGNYGESAANGQDLQVTTENLQGRLRYDRYLLEDVSLFLIGTGRHDRFQGLDFRLNVDPGLKYLFVSDDTSSLWGELGYDFQYDVRRDEARVQLDSNNAPIPGAPLLDKTATDHSGRAFVGFKHAFNKEVTLTTGLEYLQSVVDSTRYRLNYDLLFAANVGGGLALGVGFTARYDHAPLPAKKDLDTATTLSLIYSFSDIPEPPAPAPAAAPAATPAAPAQ